MRRGGVNEKTVVESALEVPEDALDVVKMGNTRVMHEEASLLHGVSKLRTSEGHVLQGSGEAAVEGGIRVRFAARGKLGSSLSGSTRWVTLEHASFGKDVKSVLPLRQKKARR